MEEDQGLISINPGLLSALSKGSSFLDVFSKDLLVLECLVAGTSFRQLEPETEKELTTQVRLELKREPANEYDRFATALFFEKHKIGYIPKNKNETIARLLDAGKAFYATILVKEWEGNWLRIEIKVFLKD